MWQNQPHPRQHMCPRVHLLNCGPSLNGKSREQSPELLPRNYTKPPGVLYLGQTTGVPLKKSVLRTATTASQRRLPGFLDCAYTSKKTEASAVKYTGNPHTEINIYSVTLTTPSGVQTGSDQNEYMQEALKTCRNYWNWDFVKSTKLSSRHIQWNHFFIPYFAGVSEKLRRIFIKHCIPVHFKPSNTMTQKPVQG